MKYSITRLMAIAPIITPFASESAIIIPDPPTITYASLDGSNIYAEAFGSYLLVGIEKVANSINYGRIDLDPINSDYDVAFSVRNGGEYIWSGYQFQFSVDFGTPSLTPPRNILSSHTNLPSSTSIAEGNNFTQYLISLPAGVRPGEYAEFFFNFASINGGSPRFEIKQSAITAVPEPDALYLAIASLLPMAIVRKLWRSKCGD